MQKFSAEVLIHTVKGGYTLDFTMLLPFSKVKVSIWPSAFKTKGALRKLVYGGEERSEFSDGFVT